MTDTNNILNEENYFVINEKTGKIENPSGDATLAQRDHYSKIFNFEMPRYIEGHDMMLCNKVNIHFINIDGKNINNRSKGVYPMEDICYDTDSGEKLTFAWRISREATKYAGALNFLISFAHLTGERIDYEWNTEIYKGVPVTEGMNNGEAVAEEYSDLLEAWKAEILADVNTKLAEARAAAASAAGSAGAAEISERNAAGAADAALREAKAYTDALKIGGRNYASLNSLNFAYAANASVSGATVTARQVGQSQYLVLSCTNYKPKNKGVHTISGYLKINGEIPSADPFSLAMVNTYNGAASVRRYYDTKTGYFYFTEDYKDNWFIHTEVRGLYENVTFSIENLMFEAGDKPTDRTPAPEDVAAETNALKARVQALEAAMGINLT